MEVIGHWIHVTAQNGSSDLVHHIVVKEDDHFDIIYGHEGIIDYGLTFFRSKRAKNLDFAIKHYKKDTRADFRVIELDMKKFKDLLLKRSI